MADLDDIKSAIETVYLVITGLQEVQEETNKLLQELIQAVRELPKER